MDLVNLSGNLLYAAFILYLIATLFFGATIRDKRSTKSKKGISGNIAITITILGFLAQLGYFITRWMASGHAPLGNMFEFVTFLGMAMVLGFIIIYFMYRIGFLGLFALPLAMIIIAYASMFPTQLAPLVPTLNTSWLYIHVSTVAVGQGILFISFVAGLMYLIKKIDQKKRTKKNIGLELILYMIFLFVGFIVSTTTFSIMDYDATFEYQDGTQIIETEYRLPAIAAPNNGVLLTENVMEPWFEAPGWMQGADAGRKFNTVIWSVITGTILYGLTVLILRKRVGAALQPLLRGVKAELLDEIMYRAVTIGFPIFTLGGLIFASIWAQIAWGRFWGWDPKEVWALITWFFYAAFLHLRLSRGWHGEKSGWLAVIGFGIILFNLIVVNLVIAGLHSYA
ncbi:c-type cytochrome biogenesis protein CcsB [Oceanobacillus alkalisoli]|uniref:c-type cytochrome biogenesis protein CcsB n=1 Tax=Oceanobacillus alkalisoli TaxID=2925113 RepID=UPI001EF0EDE8|nr:c-type cytochrome biogenesis protein CcsB [Oceanobacillus alkalisoli]MCF3942261.1 c-type cytochrome biogenesis protein CcsB [Oceanobacillus alkalisoli]MCG5104497.1 c-type cytochrome biogenesis protein CcsB [Oceanobacillus alkalisoli]